MSKTPLAVSFFIIALAIILGAASAQEEHNRSVLFEVLNMSFDMTNAHDHLNDRAVVGVGTPFIPVTVGEKENETFVAIASFSLEEEITSLPQAMNETPGINWVFGRYFLSTTPAILAYREVNTPEEIATFAVQVAAAMNNSGLNATLEPEQYWVDDVDE